MSSLPGFEKVIVAASMLACDFSDVGGEAERAETAGADWLHMDVMDGHFVDNISFGPAFVAAARKSSGLPVDVHLMITRPDHYFPRFVEFAELFDPREGTPVVVVHFLALLELSREGLVQITQAEPFAPMYVRLAYTAS